MQLWLFRLQSDLGIFFVCYLSLYIQLPSHSGFQTQGFYYYHHQSLNSINQGIVIFPFSQFILSIKPINSIQCISQNNKLKMMKENILLSIYFWWKSLFNSCSYWIPLQWRHHLIQVSYITFIVTKL